MRPMDGLSEADLAARSDTTVERLRRLADLGIVARAADGSFLPANIQRVRLADTLERSGVDLDAVGRAIAEGALSFSFMDLMYDRPAAYSDQTYEEAARSHGWTVEFVQRVHEALGLPRPDAGDRVREDDAKMFAVGAFATGIGMGEAQIERVLRVYGENIGRIAQAESPFFHAYVEEPMLRSGLPLPQMLELAGQISPQLRAMVGDLILWVYRRQQEHAIMEHVVEHLEAGLEDAGYGIPKPVSPPAMVFLDLVGYTRLTEERGDEAAVEMVTALADVVRSESARHGGRPVKWLGDGVMFHFPQPARAVRCSLELALRVPQAGLPPAHVGVNAGPVIFRDGDYFGRTVNIASRIASKAGAGEVVVSQAVVEACPREDDLRFEPLGAAELKGVERPVPLFRAGPGPGGA